MRRGRQCRSHRYAAAIISPTDNKASIRERSGGAAVHLIASTVVFTTNSGTDCTPFESKMRARIAYPMVSGPPMLPSVQLTRNRPSDKIVIWLSLWSPSVLVLTSNSGTVVLPSALKIRAGCRSRWGSPSVPLLSDQVATKRLGESRNPYLTLLVRGGRADHEFRQRLLGAVGGEDPGADVANRRPVFKSVTSVQLTKIRPSARTARRLSFECWGWKYSLGTQRPTGSRQH